MAREEVRLSGRDLRRLEAAEGKLKALAKRVSADAVAGALGEIEGSFAFLLERFDFFERFLELNQEEARELKRALETVQGAAGAAERGIGIGGTIGAGVGGVVGFATGGPAGAVGGAAVGRLAGEVIGGSVSAAAGAVAGATQTDRRGELARLELAERNAQFASKERLRLARQRGSMPR